MGMPVIKPCCISKEKVCVSKEKTIGDIIESIAMQEMSLAHILNAESEKLQRIINSPNTTPKQILEANNSVRNTINAISRLEMQLQAKIELFINTICK